MADDTKDGRKPSDAIEAPHGQAPSDKPALEPYWGKPAVRNLRGDDGNVGIIRSPVRAIVLPDRHAVSGLRHSLGRCANCARVAAMRTAHRHRRRLKW